MDQAWPTTEPKKQTGTLLPYLLLCAFIQPSS
jgi:hypothetical protein